jgi:hypothetical protein
MQVAQRSAPDKTSTWRPSVNGREQSHDARNITVVAMRRGWPLIAICGGAMASTAWLPSDNPSLGFLVLGAEVVLGIYAVARLVSPGK